MKNRLILKRFIVSLLILALGPQWSLALPASSRNIKPALTAPISGKVNFHKGYGRTNLTFEPNVGQTDPQVKFISHGAGYAFFLTDSEAVLSFRYSSSPAPSGSPKKHSRLARSNKPSGSSVKHEVIRTVLVGEDPNASMKGVDQTPGATHYLIGNDRSKWHQNVRQYGKVKLANAYPGIDVVYYGQQGQLEYDFDVKSGADCKIIGLKYKGVQSATINDKGDLELAADQKIIRFKAPVAYQMIDNVKTSVPVKYISDDQGVIGFEVGDYDHSKDLVIDPALDYSTYLGGTTEDEAAAVAVDNAGDAYITGFAESTDFPTTSGAFQTTGQDAVFVSEFSADGQSLIYSTYVGGLSSSSFGNTIAVNSSGNAYVAGSTSALDFPITAGAYQNVNKAGGYQNGYVMELAADGSALIFSTYLGGSINDSVSQLALDASGLIYLTGVAGSGDFPTTNGAFQTTDPNSAYGQIFVTKMNANGTGLIYSTYLGGANVQANFGEYNPCIAVDNSGNAVVVGTTGAQDFPTTAGAYSTVNTSDRAFAAKLNASGSSLLYSTFFGSDPGNSSNVFYPAVYGMTLDAGGNIYAVGSAPSPFMTTTGAYQTSDSAPYDGFFVELNPGGNGTSDLVYSTYIENTTPSGISLNGANAFITGEAIPGFQTTSGVYQTTLAGDEDAFLSVMNPGGNGYYDLIYATYLGGPTGDTGYPGVSFGSSVAQDNSGNVFIAGSTTATDFPLNSPFQTSNQEIMYSAFLTKFDVSNFTVNANRTLTPAPTSTSTFTSTVTFTPTNTFGPGTFTPTWSATGTSTNTVVATQGTDTPTVTITPSPTNTPLPGGTATNTATNTATTTATNTCTNTGTNTCTNTPTNTTGTPGTFTSTPTITPSPTYTPTGGTATNTATTTATNTCSNTPTDTCTNTATNTTTNTPTHTSTNTITATATYTGSPLPTNTQGTLTPTLTVTPTPTNTMTFTFTYTSTITNVFTRTNTPINTPTNTFPAGTFTPTNTNSFTPTSTATNTASETATNTATSTSTNTVTSTYTNTAVPNTSTYTATNTPTNTNTPSPTNTYAPGTFTPTVTFTATATQTWTGTNTPTPTGGTAMATNTRTNSPTNTTTRTATYTPTLMISTVTFTVTPSMTNTQTPTTTVVGTATATPIGLVISSMPPAYPNPSSGAPIVIRVAGGPYDKIVIHIYTISHRRVDTITYPATSQYETDISWDLRDALSTVVANGLYYVVIETTFHGSIHRYVQKVLVLR